MFFQRGEILKSFLVASIIIITSVLSGNKKYLYYHFDASGCTNLFQIYVNVQAVGRGIFIAQGVVGFGYVVKFKECSEKQ